MPPPPPPPANEENLNDDDEAVDVYYEADNTTRSNKGQKEDLSVNPITEQLKAHLEINVSTAMQLQKLDEEQRQTLADLQFYA